MFKLALGVFLAVTCSAFGKDAISFSSLKEGESIRFTFSSTGCFHRMTRAFEFHGTSVTISSPDHSSAKLKSDPQTAEIGTLEVSRNDLQKLDRLLRFYRENTQGGCTTEDHIQIEQTRSDGHRRTETYTDASCQAEHVEDALTFPQLQARLIKQTTP